MTESTAPRWCPNCGKPVYPGAGFCPSCGAQVFADGSFIAPKPGDPAPPVPAGPPPITYAAPTPWAGPQPPPAAGPSWPSDNRPSRPPSGGAAPKRGSTLGPILVILIVLIAGGAFLSQYRTPAATPGTPGSPARASTVNITYLLTGSAIGADLTYTDGSGNIQQQSNVRVPLKRTSGADGIVFAVPHGTFVQFSAQNNGDSGDLTCSIDADGTVINTGHSSGAFVIVSCSARVP